MDDILSTLFTGFVTFVFSVAIIFIEPYIRAFYEARKRNRNAPAQYSTASNQTARLPKPTQAVCGLLLMQC
jgi:hypothetical protein